MSQLPTNLQDLLNAIRGVYVDDLSAAVRTHGPCHVEPALRMQDGTLATEGTPATPCRVDLIAEETGETVRVDSTRQLTFQTTSYDVDGATLNIAPFFWDAANFRVTGAAHAAADLIARWFDLWFDPEDQRTPDDAGLYGVVHSLSNVEPAGKDWTCQIDFGSASAQAFTDLIDALIRAGATSIEVS